MDNTREKLIDLITDKENDLIRKIVWFTDAYRIKEVADHLIANGVTFATDNNVGDKWIPLSAQKPDRDDLIIVFFEGMRDTPAAIQIMYGWCIGGSASHWMPLPEPPKGE